ncbi:High affinity copper uptake protein 1 [Orchesella cincta]|uniref:Copper transport protein n=1 Tax=Orchesella cincta TaxID=48709 RepID=A0A1D2N5Y5_ORCCI|nr:High affinity copper uptake protein 1 [Orchesella cincta]
MDHKQHDHGGGDTGEMDMMAMYFTAGTKVTILFKFWDTSNNVGVFVASLIIVFFLALIYEALKFYRDVLYEKSATLASDRAVQGLLGGIRDNIFKRYHLVQTFLHMIQLVLSYFLMLIFMTYNVWLAVAVTLGAGVGYLLFGWNKRSATDITEHCH